MKPLIYVCNSFVFNGKYELKIVQSCRAYYANKALKAFRQRRSIWHAKARFIFFSDTNISERYSSMTLRPALGPWPSGTSASNLQVQRDTIDKFSHSCYSTEVIRNNMEFSSEMVLLLLQPIIQWLLHVIFLADV